MTNAPKTFATAYDFALVLAARWLPDGRITYNNQDAGVALSIATALANADRKRGRAAPERGHSAEHMETASRAVKAWQQSAAGA